MHNLNMTIKVNTVLSDEWGAAELTTDHAMSCLGIPVLIVGDQVYGPDSVAYTDEDGFAVLARELKITCAESVTVTPDDPADLLCEETEAEKNLRERFDDLQARFTTVAQA
jgi:hypothetical protein